MKRLFYLLTIVALGLTACNENEILHPGEGPAYGTGAPVCRISVPASIGNGAGTKSVAFGETTSARAFADTDKVYVFLEHDGEIVGYSHTDDLEHDVFMYLSPTDIQGARCTLSGALQFYFFDWSTFELVPCVPAQGDIAILFYNLNRPYGVLNAQNTFYYTYQDGSAGCAGGRDFAMARMVISAVSGDAESGYTLTLGQEADPANEKVAFENVGSVFRQRLSFTDKDAAPVSPTVRKLTVESRNGSMVYGYCPLNKGSYVTYMRGGLELKNDTKVYDAEGDVYFAAKFHYDEEHTPEGDALTLTAEDEDENFYAGTKAAPSDGFGNGKYYYGAMTLSWQWKRTKPTLTGSTAQPNDSYQYYLTTDPVTISGNCYGYCLENFMYRPEQITFTLDNLTAGRLPENATFFLGGGFAQNVDVILVGNNTLDCENCNAAIDSSFGPLKLSCEGSSATLTVTTASADDCGLYGTNYHDGSNNHSVTGECDVTSQLAASGFTVSRSARTDGPDNDGDGDPDYYSWTYTVAPAAP